MVPRRNITLIYEIKFGVTLALTTVFKISKRNLLAKL